MVVTLSNKGAADAVGLEGPTLFGLRLTTSGRHHARAAELRVVRTNTRTDRVECPLRFLGPES